MRESEGEVGGGGSIADHKKRCRIGLIVLVTISLFVCPLAAGGFGPGGASAQIAFTPNVATLAWTQTVEGPGLGVVTPVPGFASGQYFEEDDPNRPNPEADLVAITGDDQFGYGQGRGSPDLYLVWVTDEEGTHYLVVGATDPRLMGGRADDFSDFIGDRDDRLDDIETARGWRIGSSGTMIFMGTVLVVCGLTGGVGCLPALIAGGVATGGAITWTWIGSHHEGELEDLEQNLRGRFWDMATAPAAP